MTRWHPLCGVAVFSLLAAAACSPASQGSKMATGATVEPELLARTAMRTDFGLPILELELDDGQVGRFILDTGFDVNIVDVDFARRIGLKMEQPRSELQPGGSVEMSRISEFSFRLGGFRVDGLEAQAAPISQLSSFVGLELHGILGHTFASRYVVCLNYDDGELLLYSPGVHFDSDGYRVVKIRLVQSEAIFGKGEVLLPFSIQQQGDKEYSADIKLDTGSVSALGFSANFYEDADLQRSASRYLTSSGVGAGGKTEGRLFQIDSLKFGGLEYKRVPSGVTLEAAGTERRANAGTIGAAVLARQDLVLDYPHGRILLGRPYPASKGMPEDRSGMWLIEADGKKVVFQVCRPTPASEAGLLQGDVIAEVDGMDASQFTLDEMMRLFGGAIGETHGITFNRDDETQHATLVLRDLCADLAHSPVPPGATESPSQ